MQVARLVEPRAGRSLGAKLRQMARAVELRPAASRPHRRRNDRGSAGPRRLRAARGSADRPRPDLTAAETCSTVVLDRAGTLLRPFALPDGRWRLPLSPAGDAPGREPLPGGPQHRGRIDAGMIAEAPVLVGFEQREVSTLSMQVARLVEPRAGRSLGAKLRQMARAVELERRLGNASVSRAGSWPK
jgi:membrane carboxypeptidase/penicillin-binding protein PbpC